MYHDAQSHGEPATIKFLNINDADLIEDAPESTPSNNLLLYFRGYSGVDLGQQDA